MNCAGSAGNMSWMSPVCRVARATHPDDEEDAVEAGPLEDAGSDDAATEPAAVDGEHDRVGGDEDEDSEKLRTVFQSQCRRRIRILSNAAGHCTVMPEWA